jgi:hypothetical protein
VPLGSWTSNTQGQGDNPTGVWHVDPATSAYYPRETISRGSLNIILSGPILRELLDIYFKLYHPWLPILHRSSVLSASASPDGNNSTNFIVFKAIAAVVGPTYRTEGLQIDEEMYNNIRGASQQLQREVLIYAMEHVSLQSLQALLIVSLADLGSGKLSNFWKTIALCRKLVSFLVLWLFRLGAKRTSIGTQLGLRDLVVYYGQNYNQASLVAPRMLPLPENMIEREERIRAYWMIECLDASSTLGAAWNIGLFPSFSTETLPCPDGIWESTDPAAQDSDGSETFSFSSLISLMTKELNRVHNAMQEPYDFSLEVEHTRWLRNCNEVYDELCKWRSSSLETPFAVSSFDTEGNIKFDVSIVTANIALDR